VTEAGVMLAEAPAGSPVALSATAAALLAKAMGFLPQIASARGSAARAPRINLGCFLHLTCQTFLRVFGFRIFHWSLAKKRKT